MLSTTRVNAKRMNACLQIIGINNKLVVVKFRYMEMVSIGVFTFHGEDPRIIDDIEIHLFFALCVESIMFANVVKW